MLSVRNPAFGGMIQNYSHFFNRILGLVAYCDIVFPFYYDLFEVLQGSLTFSPPSAPFYVKFVFFFSIKKIQLLFLGKVFFSILYNVFNKNYFSIILSPGMQIEQCKHQYGLILITKTARRHA